MYEAVSNRNKKINSIQGRAFEIFIRLKCSQGTEKSRWLLMHGLKVLLILIFHKLLCLSCGVGSFYIIIIMEF